MALIKKTTILFPEDLHEHLTRLARRRRVSIGHLVRSACERQYGLVSGEDRLAAVEELGRLSLPVAQVEGMTVQSMPLAEEGLP